MFLYNCVRFGAFCLLIVLRIKQTGGKIISIIMEVYMETNLFKKIKWDSIILSILMLAVGVLYVVLPSKAGDVTITVFGVMLIVAGLVSCVRYFMYDRFLSDHILIISIVMLVLGIFTLIYPKSIQAILTIVFGLIIVIDSISSICDSAYLLKVKVYDGIILIILSIITAILGVMVMFSNFESVMVFAGVSLIIDGVRKLVTTIVFSVKVNKAKKQFVKSVSEYLDN